MLDCQGETHTDGGRCEWLRYRLCEVLSWTFSNVATGMVMQNFSRANACCPGPGQNRHGAPDCCNWGGRAALLPLHCH